MNALGSFSSLAVELREAIWSYALTDTTIVYHAVTKAVPIPLLGCSRTIREEVISTILRERSVTFQTHAALSGLLTNCKSEQTTGAANDNMPTAMGQCRLPRKLRLLLFYGFGEEYKETKAAARLDPQLRKADEEDLIMELDGWRNVLQQYPITNLITVTLDCNWSPRYHGGPGFAPPCLTTFIKRVTMRFRMVSKGKCQCLLVAPPSTISELMWHAGNASILRKWTPDDEGWYAKRIRESLSSLPPKQFGAVDPPSSSSRRRKRRRADHD
jgi:hypothetical protein